MLKRTISLVFIFSLVFGFPALVLAQPTWTLDPFGKEKKPEQFENRKLGSEKTADKKFTVARNFYQNNITHYNYYFNANNRVNTVIDRAKLSYKDDYSSLLAFYPYTIESTSAQKTELDSVIYTSTAGILLHDLRNDWIDNMYMLIGKAYFLRGDFDSALMTFQFINYNLFPRKRKNDDDDRIVGTTSSASGSSISIANKEKRNILQKAVALPPSRNEALIWLARTLIEQDEFGESGGLINTLQNDPNLPKRLYNDLEEVNAYWFYKQANYDSAAVHLEKALSAADTKQDRSRWEFLLAQLYEMGGSYDKASDYYTRASKHTVDPLLDIYARLNEAKMLKGAANPKDLDRSIDNLLKMAKKDKFESFRDIIYYSAGQLALQKPDTNTAIIYFNKSLRRNESNINYKNRTYLQLADIAYARKQYRIAAAMYDSLQNGPDTILNKRIAELKDRKDALSKIAEAITNIEREDSLQRIAALPPAERDDLIKKLVRKLRKENGLKDDGSSSGGDLLPFGSNNNPQPIDLFAGNTRGEWYFYNSSLKSRGFNEFKTKWGNRANGDNWRRKSAVAGNITTNPPGTTLDPKGNVIPVVPNSGAAQSTDISYDALITNLPLTEEKLTASSEIIASNMLDLAKLYQNELEEYGLAAATYEDYLTRFPVRLQDGEVYLALYYCYTKLGDVTRADYYKGLLNRRFANSRSATMLNNPSSLDPKAKNPEATKLYEDIYTLFIEGDLEKAMMEKKKADSIYGVNYWTPQLLYIEALQHVKNRDDSMAIKSLRTLMDTYPTSPLKEKAATMIDVLKRRAEIESYLTSLQITRDQDDKPVKVDDKPVVVKPVVKAPVTADTAKKIIPPLSNAQFAMSLGSPHYVVMILDKVDGVYVNEARNAFNRYNKENFYGQPIEIIKDALDADHNLLVISPFPDATAALQYYDKIKRSAASEISWLPANKYSFIIITDANLQLLKTNKNIPGYKSLLNTQYPNRF